SDFGSTSAAPAAPAHTRAASAHTMVVFSIHSSLPRPLRRTARTAHGGRSPAARRGSILVLEGDLHLGAVRQDLAVLEMHVELRDLGDAEVAQRLRCPLDGRARRLLP